MKVVGKEELLETLNREALKIAKKVATSPIGNESNLMAGNISIILYAILSFGLYQLIRKKNKLPADTYSEDFELEYGKATVEIHKDSIQKNEKVIIIDDLIATGGTAKAAAKLVERSGGKVECFVFVINLFDLGGVDILEKQSYKTISLINFPGH